MNRSCFLSASAAFAISACATTTPPTPAALEFSPISACDEALSNVAAIDLTPEEETGSTVQFAAFAPESPCLARDEGPTPYAMFKMPTSGEVASLHVGSPLEPLRVVPSKIVTLDASLNEIRSFDPENLRQRGKSLSHLFRPQPDEAFVAIVADATQIGEHFSYIQIDESMDTPPPNLGNAYHGAGTLRRSVNVPFSMEGLVFVRVFFSAPDATPTT